MSNAAKNFDVLAIILAFYIIILTLIQQNYFSDLYRAKILNFSAKPFFPFYARFLCVDLYVLMIMIFQ